MVYWFKALSLVLALGLVQACGGVSDDDDNDSGGDNGGGEIPGGEPLPPVGELVTVANGVLRGERLVVGDLVLYQGIPYAAPPEGDNRWRAPLPALDWLDVRDAIEPGANCIQGDLRDLSAQSEDCLFLNVAAPAAETENPRPVMVWFHGGDEDNGSGARLPADIAYLAAASGNVVVSVNARLGFLGFLALPGLAIESADASTGNYHHLDQVAALQWVRDNIASFNGNPNNVTIFGESAGGNDVCRHLASPLSAGLFQRAIMQSARCGPALTRSLAAAYEQGEDYKQLWGCNIEAGQVLDCLRQQSPFDLRQALADAGKFNDSLGPDREGQLRFRSVAAIDDHVFDAEMYDALRLSPANIDVMIGVTRNEGTLFQQRLGNVNPVTQTDYQSAVSDAFPTLNAGEVVTITELLYPRFAYLSYSDAFADVLGDADYACTAVATADVLAAGGHAVRFYQFSREVSDELLLALVGAVDPNAPVLGAAHTADLYYLWNADSVLEGPLPALTVQAMQQYWSSFAANGVPLAEDRSQWPLYSATGGEYLDFGLEIADAVGFKLEQCDFFDSARVR